jgi:hypothetical protein
VRAIAAGLVRRDPVELASGPVSWHSEAHIIVSAALHVDQLLARLLLARALGCKVGRA